MALLGPRSSVICLERYRWLCIGWLFWCYWLARGKPDPWQSGLIRDSPPCAQWGKRPRLLTPRTPGKYTYQEVIPSLYFKTWFFAIRVCPKILTRKLINSFKWLTWAIHGTLTFSYVSQLPRHFKTCEVFTVFLFINLSEHGISYFRKSGVARLWAKLENEKPCFAMRPFSIQFENEITDGSPDIATHMAPASKDVLFILFY